MTETTIAATSEVAVLDPLVLGHDLLVGPSRNAADLSLYVGVATIAFSVLYLLSDVLEVIQGAAFIGMGAAVLRGKA
jgi:hypothetical protein